MAFPAKRGSRGTTAEYVILLPRLSAMGNDDLSDSLSADAVPGADADDAAASDMVRVQAANSTVKEDQEGIMDSIAKVQN